ncbi:MAG: HD domain-containing protein, partial [Firmicutes bacterium]|nr:HD domain-containing protein [Bacillota bacterium]
RDLVRHLIRTVGRGRDRFSEDPLRMLRGIRLAAELGQRPHDWDVATAALPEVVMDLFPSTYPTGLKHGTVTVLLEGERVEVTTFRREGSYRDFRHPDNVTFTGELAEDLGRRDFTINALALDRRGRLVDLVGGRRDLVRHLIRTVGRGRDRFSEDPLRMLRGIRLAAELGFNLAWETWEDLLATAPLLAHVSSERIRDEFSRCLLSPNSIQALERLRLSGLLALFLPELLEGVGVTQNEFHRFTVWEHSLLTVGAIRAELHLRLAALFHDVGKPRTRSQREERVHFFNHEQVGAEMTRDALSRLRYPGATIDRVVHLVGQHMSLHYTPGMKDAAIRRVIARVGRENIPDLVALLVADRRASGTKEGGISPGTLELLARAEDMLKKDPLSLQDLAVQGQDVMAVTGLPPGPPVGKILRGLLELVLEEPRLNQRDVLLEKIAEVARREGVRTIPDQEA